MFGNKIRCSQRRRRVGALGDAMTGAPTEIAQARPAVHSRWLSAAVALLCALAGLTAMAQQPHAQAVVAPPWPSKPVRIVVPWPPGGSADLIGRMLAEHLSNAFAQSVLVENRPGASGMVGSAAVAHADPDGATFVISGIPSHVIAPATSANAPFDPMKEFTHIAYIGGAPIVITAHASLAVTSLPQLAALARGRDQPIGYVSPGVGSLGHMVGEYLARKDGIRLEHIPYKGTSGVMSDLVGNHVSAMFVPTHVALPLVADRQIRILGVASAERVAAAPDVPTLAEQGVTGFEVDIWFGLLAPAGTPADAVELYNTAINAFLRSPEVAGTLAKQGLVTAGGPPAALGDLIAHDMAKWQQVIQQAGITAE
jgi:tripartite-type tricarboxylate transporter receptor subunit TctC